MQAEHQSCGVVLIQYLVHFLTDKALEFGIVRLELLAPCLDFGKDPVGGCLDQGRGGPCWCSSQRRRTQCQQDSEQSGDRSHGVFSWAVRSEEHTSELQSLMRISYAVFCLKKKQ